MRWLPPEAISRLGRLEFSPHGTVDGFIAGKHRSARKGASVEFAEHREYTPGDDLRKLDWKLIARRQRYYVREFIDETNLRSTILLDTSGSMGYRGSAAADGFSKLEYAQHLAAALSYVLPVIVGVMFTLLHALIQAYVLTMLVSTFYGESTEKHEKKPKAKKVKKSRSETAA